MLSSIVNISAYRFTHLSSDFVLNLQVQLKKQAQLQGLKGTVLLSNEGINLFLAGEKQLIASFKSFLNGYPCFQGMNFKESISQTQPFKRLFVKIKQEIIPFGVKAVQPALQTAPYISPKTLNHWLKNKSDWLLLDTRNAFEVAIGSFESAQHLDIAHFRQFPKAANALLKEEKKTPIVTFCTGGIRCEKAATYLLQQGFEEVYQLEGGILNYFEQCGGEFYQGDCFVFDERIALNPRLEPANYKQE